MSQVHQLISARLLRFAPLMAAVVFGGWAAYVNSEYGLFVLLRTGLGQGLYALFSTWIVSKTAVDIYAFAGGKLRGFVAGFIASFLIMVSIPLAIHHVLGTPEIIAAILPGIIWGSGYIATYLWVFSKDNSRRQAQK